MGTGQILITLSAMILLSMVILRTNTSFLMTDSVLYETKYEVLAVSIATSIIEEANGLAFDARTDTATVSSTTDLTSAYGLGPAPGETYEVFNDFDDFNGFTRVDNSMPSAEFNIVCKVSYVSPDNPDVDVNYQTWHKKITVDVFSESMVDTITMSSIFSYWFYR